MTGRPPRGEVRHVFKSCLTCGKEMKLCFAHSAKKYCCNRCYGDSKIGKPVHTPQRYRAYGRAVAGPRNPNWKGGWTIDHQRRMHAEWCRRNPDKVTARNHRRRAVKKNAPGNFTADEWAAVKAAHGYRCVACKKPETMFDVLTVDHKIPLTKGGTNDAGNIQPMCLQCNSSKGNRDGWRGRKKRAA